MLRLETGNALGFYSNSDDDCLVPIGWGLTSVLFDWRVLVLKELATGNEAKGKAHCSRPLGSWNTTVQICVNKGSTECRD